MGILVIGLNNDSFIVDRERFEDVVKSSKEDWIKVTEWVEACGTLIPQEDIENYGKSYKL